MGGVTGSRQGSGETGCREEAVFMDIDVLGSIIDIFDGRVGKVTSDKDANEDPGEEPVRRLSEKKC
jgi:hypothetical protein